MTIGVDPALFDLVGSLARPRGNVTGFTLMTPKLTAKRLEVLRTALPHIWAVAVLLNPANPASKAYLQTTEEAARSLALPIVARVEMESVEALLALRPTAFTDANAVVVMQDGMFWNHRRDVLALVNSTRLPAIYAEREFADDGGLIAYGANISDNFHRAASYVDRILKTRRLADSGAGEVRFHRQPEDRTRAWPDDPPAILVSADEVIE